MNIGHQAKALRVAMPRRRIIWNFGWLVVAATAITACSSGGQPAKAAGEPSGSSQSSIVGPGATSSSSGSSAGTGANPASRSSQPGNGSLGTIRVYVTVPQSSPFVAIEGKDILGTWEGSGLNVELINGSTPKADQAIAAGQADVSLPGATGFVGMAKGVPEVAVGTIMGAWTQVMIVSKDSKIDSLAGLKGANFGLTGATSPGMYSIHKVAEAEGWAKSDYKTTILGTLPSIVAALKAGSIDAFPWSIDEGLKLQEQGIGKIVGEPDSIKNLVGEIYFQGFIVREAYAKEHPEALRTFFTYYYNEVQKIKSDPSLAAKVLSSWGFSPSLADQVSKSLAQSLSADGQLSAEGLTNTINEVAFVTGMSPNDIPRKWTYWKDLPK